MSAIDNLIDLVLGNSVLAQSYSGIAHEASIELFQLRLGLLERERIIGEWQKTAFNSLKKIDKWKHDLEAQQRQTARLREYINFLEKNHE